MARVKLSDLPMCPEVTSECLLPIVSGTTTYKTTISQLVDELPAGPAGPQGEPGEPGATGATGSQGIQGPPGDDGADGATGATGPEGPEGPQGPQGQTGNTGNTGSQGIQGIQGPAGSTGADGFGGGSVVKKTADQTFNSATPANVTSLSFAVVAGRYYRYEFWVIVRSDTSTVGVALGVTYPAVTRAAATGMGLIASGAGGSFDTAITASGGHVITTAVPVINTDYLAKVEGLIVPSANGTLQLQARTETGTTVVTVRQGSCGFLWDMGT
jgi:hypothetical protein